MAIRQGIEAIRSALGEFPRYEQIPEEEDHAQTKKAMGRRIPWYWGIRNNISFRNQKNLNGFYNERDDGGRRL